MSQPNMPNTTPLGFDLDTDLEEQEQLQAEADAEDAALAAEEVPDFDDLLSEALDHAKDVTAAKAALARLKRGGLSEAERLADLARIREWEAKHVYEAVANVAFFLESRCENCGNYEYLFSGLFQRQVHKQVETTQRWVTVDETDPELPNEIMRDFRVAPMCSECCESLGFEWSSSYFNGDPDPDQTVAEAEDAADLDDPQLQPQPEGSDNGTPEAPDSLCDEGSSAPTGPGHAGGPATVQPPGGEGAVCGLAGAGSHATAAVVAWVASDLRALACF